MYNVHCKFTATCFFLFLNKILYTFYTQEKNVTLCWNIIYLELYFVYNINKKIRFKTEKQRNRGLQAQKNFRLKLELA